MTGDAAKDLGKMETILKSRRPPRFRSLRRQESTTNSLDFNWLRREKIPRSRKRCQADCRQERRAEGQRSSTGATFNCPIWEAAPGAATAEAGTTRLPSPEPLGSRSFSMSTTRS